MSTKLNRMQTTMHQSIIQFNMNASRILSSGRMGSITQAISKYFFVAHRKLTSNSEICQLGVTLVVEQDVASFDIAMYFAPLV